MTTPRAAVGAAAAPDQSNLVACTGYPVGLTTLAIPGGGVCQPGTTDGPLSAAPCSRGTAFGTDAVAYSVGCHCRSGRESGAPMCPMSTIRDTLLGNPAPARTGPVTFQESDAYDCGNVAAGCSGLPAAQCFGAITSHPSESSWTMRDACCRNDAAFLACDDAHSKVGGCPAGTYGTLPPGAVPSAATLQANYACAYEHCWRTSDACDDAMARVAMQPAADPTACESIPVATGDGGTRLEIPASCSNMTATGGAYQTGATASTWYQGASQDKSETRRAWSDFAALQYCNTHTTDPTCACLRAEESTYKDPVLGKTYTELVQQFEDTFGAAAVESSGIVARKACWWKPCDAASGQGFLRTSATRAQNATCPNVQECIATVRDLSLQSPTDVVCITQNCSSHASKDALCAAAAATVRAAVDHTGQLPEATGTQCSQCNAAINEALRGTPFRVGKGARPSAAAAASSLRVGLAVGLGSAVAVGCLIGFAVVLKRLRGRHPE